MTFIIDVYTMIAKFSQNHTFFLTRGSQKGGGVSTFGENPQIITFFFMSANLNQLFTFQRTFITKGICAPIRAYSSSSSSYPELQPPKEGEDEASLNVFPT